MLRERGVNETELFNFFNDKKGKIFGSLVLAAVLNTRNFADMDIMHTPCENWQVRRAMSLVDPTCAPHENTKFQPGFMCAECTKHMTHEEGSLQTQFYSRKLKGKSISYDLVELKEPTTARTFDIDAITFDIATETFYMPMDIMMFVALPTFRIQKLASIQFESVYDVWGNECHTNACTEEYTQEPNHLYENYYCAQVAGALSLFNMQCNNLPKAIPSWLPLPLLNKVLTPAMSKPLMGDELIGLLTPDHATPKEEELQKQYETSVKKYKKNSYKFLQLVRTHYLVGKNTKVSDYRAAKTLLRVIKLKQ